MLRLARLPLPLRVTLIAGAVLSVLYGATCALVATNAVQARLLAQLTDATGRRFGVRAEASRISLGLLTVRLGELRLTDVARRGGIEASYVEIRPDLAALLHGVLRPRSLRVSALHAHLDVPHDAAPGWTLALDDVWVTLEHEAHGLVATAQARLPDGGILDAHGRAEAGDALAGTLTIDGATSADLGVPAAAARHIFGRLAAQARVAYDHEHGLLTLHLDADGPDLAVAHPSLAESALGPLPWRAAATWRWDAARGLLALDDARFELDDNLVLEAAATLEPQTEGLIAAELAGSAADMQSFVRSLPPDLQPSPEAPALGGQVRALVSLRGPWREPSTWEVTSRLDLSALHVVLPPASAALAAGSFVHHLDDESTGGVDILIGRENPSFVPLAELPAEVAGAVTTAEDGGFFGHHGFDLDELKNSVLAVAAAGRAVRGGSTISQQLAKNLYLSREKTLNRKVREALITLGLEVAVPKARLLEIYLNLIEWGPGVFGIGQAAEHYFAKDARRLSVREAAYLASLIPSPRRYHTTFERGELSPAWTLRVNEILAKMADNGWLDDADLAQALAAPLVFAPHGCVPEGETCAL